MREIIWRFATDTLDSDETVRPIFEEIGGLGAFEPSVYDLNQKEQWRDFDLDRAVVDALTQRTQLVRIQGDDERTMAMVAMGKHGEEPTAVIRVRDCHAIPDLAAEWPGLFEALSLRMTLVTSPDWRDAVEAAGLAWDEQRLPVAMACGWPVADAPSWLGDVELGESIILDRSDTCVTLTLAPNGELEGSPHQRHLSRVVSA